MLPFRVLPLIYLLLPICLQVGTLTVAGEEARSSPSRPDSDDQETMPTQKHRETPIRPATGDSTVYILEVKPPGTSYVPVTGRLLEVYELNDQILRGLFISHGNLRLGFESRSSGYIRLEGDGQTLLEIESLGGALMFGSVKGKSFVYDDKLSHIYEVPASRAARAAREAATMSKTERSVAGHWHRSKRSGAPTAQSDMARADIDLTKDAYFRLLPLLAQALGEFGIIAAKSPAAKPLILTGYEAEKRVHTGENATAMDAAMARANAERRDLFDHNLEMKENGGVAKTRNKRWLWSSIKKAANTVADAVSTGVTSIANSLSESCGRHNPGRLSHYKGYAGWYPCGRCEGGTCKSPNNGRPCVHTDCPGLCGSGCGCSWNVALCGDCCYHRGCFEHDICCEHSGGWTEELSQGKVKFNVCSSAFWTLSLNFSCDGGFGPYPSCQTSLDGTPLAWLGKKK